MNAVARGDHEIALVHLRVKNIVHPGAGGVNPLEAVRVLHRLSRDLPAQHDLGRCGICGAVGRPGGEGDAHAGVDGADLGEMAFAQIGEDQDVDGTIRRRHRGPARIAPAASCRRLTTKSRSSAARNHPA